MTPNPYTRLPSTAFWSRAVAGAGHGRVDPVPRPKFRIEPHHRVATAGSCFAQHISRHMRRLGLATMLTEPGHPHLKALARDFHYGIYTARYGNIYSARQLRQLFDRAFGGFSPTEPAWRKGEVWVDPFRPLIPHGFATLEEYERDRAQHLAAVRRMFEEMDILIFTLGLTETWRSRADGAVFPSCPGTIAGVWDEAAYEFVNSDVSEVVGDLEALWAQIKAVNPGARMLLTVSPVPLVATARDEHVLVANTYSKSVLRVAADMIAGRSDDIGYFPSYELITGPQARGSTYEADCREVRDEAVALVMDVFSRSYLGEVGAREPEADSTAPSDVASAKTVLEAVCEEIYNDRSML